MWCSRNSEKLKEIEIRVRYLILNLHLEKESRKPEELTEAAERIWGRLPVFWHVVHDVVSAPACKYS